MAKKIKKHRVKYQITEKAKELLEGMKNGFVFDIRAEIEWIDEKTGGAFNSKYYSPMVYEDIPFLKRGTLEYDEFWDEQDRRCISGYVPVIDGVEYPRISGPHYFYLNHFQIMMLREGDKKKKLNYPYYRVLDHMLFLELEKAEQQGYGIIVGKARRMGLSYVGSVMILWNMLFFKDNTVAVGAGKEDKAQDLFNKVVKSLENIREEYRISYRKRKDDMKFAYSITEHKVRKDEGIGSQLDVRTFFSDPSAFEGGSYSFFIFEEIGIHDNLIKSFKASEPCFTEGAIQFGVPFLFGCVCEGTKVWDNNGNLVNVEDLKQENGILGYNGEGVEKENIVWMKPPAKKNCYRIETTGGNFIECSDDHPLMWSKSSFRGSYNKKKVTFQLSKDVKVGDQLMVLNEVPVFGKETIKDARLIGLLIGDGNYSKGVTPQLSVGDIEVGNYVKRKYKTKTYKSHIKKEGGIYESIGIHNFQETLKNHGIYGQVKTKKRLPKNISIFNKESVTELLGGYYDADGNVNYNKKKNTIRVVLSSISEELLIEVKYQLLKLGIGSSLVKENRNTKPSKGYEGQQNHIFRLYINRKDDVVRFQKEIKFLCKHKQTVLNKVLTLKSNGNNIKLNPCSFELNPKNDKGHFFIGKDNLQGLRSERVTKIKCIGQKDVYNMHTGYSNTYLSNGFVTKQTGGEVEKGSKDYKIMYDNPASYNLKKLFIPKYMYYPGADPEEKQIDKMDIGKNFFDIRTGLNDEEGSLKHIMKRRMRARKSKEGYIKEVQSNPIKESDIFLKTSGGLLNRIALAGQRERIYNKENNYDVIQGSYHWDDTDAIIPLLSRCRNTKEKNLIRIKHNITVRFEEDSDGKAFMLKGIIPINQPGLPWNPDIIGIDSYDDEEVVESGSLGCSLVYRCYSNMSNDYDMPIAYINERGDGTSEDSFWDNSLKQSVYFKAESLVEYTKIAIINYFKDVYAHQYLRVNPSLRDDLVTNNGKQQYGVRMTSGKNGFKSLVTTLLKTEVKDNVDKIHFEKVIDDLIEYGDKNTDIAMAFGVCLIHKLDLFDYITEDLQDEVGEADVLMDWVHAFDSGDGKIELRSYDGNERKSEMDTFDPRMHLEGEQREAYLVYHDAQVQQRKKEREKSEKAYIKSQESFDPFKSQIEQHLKAKQ